MFTQLKKNQRKSNIMRDLVKEGITMRTLTPKAKRHIVTITMWTAIKLPPWQHKNRNPTFPKEPKFDLSPLYDRENVEEYLEWKIKVEKIFEFHQVNEIRRLSMTTLNFKNMLYLGGNKGNKTFQLGENLKY